MSDHQTDLCPGCGDELNLGDHGSCGLLPGDPAAALLVAITICEASNGCWAVTPSYSQRIYLGVADAVLAALRTGRTPRELDPEMVEDLRRERNRPGNYWEPEERVKYWRQLAAASQERDEQRKEARS